MRINLPAVGGFVGMAAITAAVCGLAGLWWGLLVAGVLLIAWAALSVADGGVE